MKQNSIYRPKQNSSTTLHIYRSIPQQVTALQARDLVTQQHRLHIVGLGNKTKLFSLRLHRGIDEVSLIVGVSTNTICHSEQIISTLCPTPDNI